ncbi:hypothetical protein BCON_0007g00330 [Botryotinia convoluta]|uniref:Uncharacterized protein n=1 Tax=Botryotinia convoluta TaxID=54673 RepID=A0A4Z1J5I7_9HELO|nr:hypothetical protein BCON_0007g00330 [Botryotinia convoluta]
MTSGFFFMNITDYDRCLVYATDGELDSTCGFETDCPGIAKTRIEIVRWKFEHSRKERSADFMGARKGKYGRYKENERAITETNQSEKFGRRHMEVGTRNSGRENQKYFGPKYILIIIDMGIRI